MKEDAVFISSGIIHAKVDEVKESLEENGLEVIAAIASIPLPQPISNTLESCLTYFSNCCIHILVVSCVPVPNAIPGFLNSKRKMNMIGILWKKKYSIVDMMEL